MFNFKRIYKRFTIFVVVQIKSLQTSDNFYIGITRNISFKGFSYLSQNTNLEVGENIEFKFKHPQYNSDVSYPGTIAWKKKDKKLGWLTGVKFSEIDEAAKSRILEIVSIVTQEPVDFLFSDKCDTDVDIAQPEGAGRVNELEAAVDDTFSVKKVQRKKIWLYILIALAIVVTLFAILENSHKTLESPIPASTKTESQEDINEKDSILAPAATESESHEAVDKKDSMPTPASVESKSHEDIVRKDSIAIVVDAQNGNIEYYVQVGSWKNPGYAQEMLLKIQRYYPEANITIHNIYHVIRIPKIKNKRQADNISKVIEREFNIKPLVVPKTK